MAFLDEIAARLIAASVCTAIGTDLFVSSRAIIPPGNGPYLLLIETGGSAPGRVHNAASPPRQRPTASVTVRATTYPAARTMAKAAYATLDGIWNTTLSGTFYLSVTARQEPTDLGLDDPGRAMVGFNIEAEKAPS